MSKRLLLADNSLAVQKLVEFSLGKEGYEITAVNDGLSALDLVERVAPDVILSDLNLKGVNVYNFCEKIRRKEKLKNTPILILVNYTDSFDEQKLRTAGVVDFIRKPLESGELIEKVKGVGEKPVPISEQVALENLARKAPMIENDRPNEDSVKIEELLGWSVAEKSPFSELSDKAEPEAVPIPSSDEDLFIIDEPVAAPAAVEKSAGPPPRAAEAPAELPADDALVFEMPGDSAQEEPPMELATAAEMLPATDAASFDVPPMDIGVPERPVELATAADMTPPSESFSEEKSRSGTTEVLTPEQFDQVKAMTEKMVAEVVARIAKEVIEKVTWDVVPSLAEIAIRKEIEKLSMPE